MRLCTYLNHPYGKNFPHVRPHLRLYRHEVVLRYGVFILDEEHIADSCWRRDGAIPRCQQGCAGIVPTTVEALRAIELHSVVVSLFFQTILSLFPAKFQGLLVILSYLYIIIYYNCTDEQHQIISRFLWLVAVTV